VKADQEQAPSASDRFDPGVAHPARVYNYWLGGKDHYLADREAGDEVARCRPDVVAGARANRAFLARAVRYLAGDCGIRQFLDIGTGLPAPDSTHEVAQRIAPECAVAYAAVPGGVTPRSHAEVTALFGGRPLVPPGVVPVTEWRPDAPVGPAAPPADLYAGIARTPPYACASTTRLGVLIG
jgi:S-adenosyl methyltransferase